MYAGERERGKVSIDSKPSCTAGGVEKLKVSHKRINSNVDLTQSGKEGKVHLLAILSMITNLGVFFRRAMLRT